MSIVGEKHIKQVMISRLFFRLDLFLSFFGVLLYFSSSGFYRAYFSGVCPARGILHERFVYPLYGLARRNINECSVYLVIPSLLLSSFDSAIKAFCPVAKIRRAFTFSLFYCYSVHLQHRHESSKLQLIDSQLCDSHLPTVHNQMAPQ